jgi:hypothetical protein
VLLIFTTGTQGHREERLLFKDMSIFAPEVRPR